MQAMSDPDQIRDQLEREGLQRPRNLSKVSDEFDPEKDSPEKE
jgi:hypothetical protein